MPTAEKQQTIKELSALMKKSAMMVLTDYRGMTVADISDLRRQMRAKGVEYHVTKNTLTVLAAEDAGIDMTSELRDLLNGPTAIAFLTDDIAAGSKMINDYLRTARVMKVKAALLEGRVMKADSLADIAKLPGRQQLLASILGTVQAPLTSLASRLNQIISGLATALKQHADNQSSGDTTATATTAEAAPASEAASTEAAPANEAAPSSEAPTDETAPASEAASTDEAAPASEAATSEATPANEEATTDAEPASEEATNEEATTDTEPASEEATTDAESASEEATTDAEPASEEATTDAAPASDAEPTEAA